MDFRKKCVVVALMALVLVASGFMFSDTLLQFYNGVTYLGNARNSVNFKCSTGMSCTKSGQTFTMTATASGSGDFSGPASSVSTDLVSFNGTGGKTGQDSGILAANVLQSGGALGTPSSGTLTNGTGLPLTTGVTGILGVGNGGTGNGTTVAAHSFFGNNTGSGAAPAFLTLAAGDLPSTLTSGTAITNAALTTPTLTTPTFTGAITTTGQGEATGSSGAINTAETILVQSGGGTSGAALAANRLVVKTRILVTLTGTCTSTVANTSSFKIRIGTGGTTSDTAVFAVTTPAAATTGTNVPFRVTLDLVVRSVGSGSSATAVGEYTIVNQGVTGLSTAVANTNSATMTGFDTTTADFITVTYVSAASTTTSTFQTASIEFPNN